MEEAIAEDSLTSDQITKIELHNAYLKFCKKKKIASKTIELFGKDIKKMNYEEKRMTGKQRKKKCMGGNKTKAPNLLTINQLELDFNLTEMSGVSGVSGYLFR